MARQTDSVEPAALILGGHYHGLGAARNLAAHGVPVYVADPEPCVASVSRAVRQCFRLPPETDEDAWEAALLALGRRPALAGAVIFPCDDEGVRLCAQRRAALQACFRVTTPPWPVTRHLYDKRLTWRLAESRGVPVPATFQPGGVAALRELPLEFPVVLKPAITPHLTALTRKKAYRADGWPELVARFETLAAQLDPREILVQELIPGRGENLYSFAGVFVQGEPRAGLAAHRPRQHPAEFGRASTFVEVVDRPELAQAAHRLLGGIGYTGLAEVEFMYNPRRGRHELLEVNARLWGWHTLAARAGLDVPYLAYRQALGADVPAGRPRAGARWVRLLTDVPVALAEWRAGRLGVGSYLASLSGVEWDLLSWRDPLPFIADLLLVPYYLKHRAL